MLRKTRSKDDSPFVVCWDSFSTESPALVTNGERSLIVRRGTRLPASALVVKTWPALFVPDDPERSLPTSRFEADKRNAEAA